MVYLFHETIVNTAVSFSMKFVLSQKYMEKNPYGIFRTFQNHAFLKFGLASVVSELLHIMIKHKSKVNTKVAALMGGKKIIAL